MGKGRSPVIILVNKTIKGQDAIARPAQSLLRLCHLHFQRYKVVQWIPHFLATNVSGSPSTICIRKAKALAFTRLGLIE